MFLSSAILAQSAGKPKYLKPTNHQKKVTTIVSEKSRSYYSLDHEKPSVISVRGPAILRVLTRGRFVPDAGTKIKYDILYIIDGGEQKKENISGAVRSKSATYLNGTLGVPGQLIDFEIELGRGDHTIEFLLEDLEVPVAVRYKLIPTKAKKQEWIAFSPMQPSEPVDLISRETSVNYYRFSIENPLKISINGPTELRVMTRIENHYHMKGRIHYRLQVKENDKVLNTYQLSSRRSEVAVYKDNKDLIPGKAREFVINVPKGKHTYEILPLDQDAESKVQEAKHNLIPETSVTQGFKSLTKGKGWKPWCQGRHPLVPESFRDRGLHPFHGQT
ncbi:MAG: hypothetical protein B6D64_11865 [Bacteroidetes bacterium 4484_276]|nr:MAG: hypothetical protein B6D64_11865 [Bacteroidetes bacterium 4484_276]